MLPNPLHPAIVHFPIVFTFLLPISAIVALWAIRRGVAPSRAWAIPVAVAAALALSSWAAVETGEQQEDRVEDVVGDRPVEAHAEMAEMFLALSAGAFLLTAAGLARGRVGNAVRLTSTVAALGLVVAGIRVGHSGGELVYEHGAAAAYVSAGRGSGETTERETAYPDDREPSVPSRRRQ